MSRSQSRSNNLHGNDNQLKTPRRTDAPFEMKKLTHDISPIKDRKDELLVYRRDRNKLSQDHIKNKSIIVKEHMDNYFRKTHNRGP